MQRKGGMSGPVEIARHESVSSLSDEGGTEKCLEMALEDAGDSM